MQRQRRRLRDKENGRPQGSQLNMGPQSQRRLTLQERTHQLQSQSHRKKQKTTGQQTLSGERAFDPLEDCAVCKAKRFGREVHRAHHRLCYHNRRTRGLFEAALSLEQEEKRLRLHFTTPSSESEKCSRQHTTKEAGQAFFAPREVAKLKVNSTTATTKTTTSMDSKLVMSSNVTPDDLCSAVTGMV